MHCWRGGKRSESLGGLLSLAGFEIYLLTGGYKAYRKSVRESFEKDQKIIILAGKTGSGKTEILQQLKKNNQQIVDLEYIAIIKDRFLGRLAKCHNLLTNNLKMTWLKHGIV
jgi:tRNA 2-selenouridine synthase